MKQKTQQKSLDSNKQFIKNKSDFELNKLMVEFDDYEFEESTFTSIENELIKEAKKVWEESHLNPIEMALFGFNWQQDNKLYSEEELKHLMTLAFEQGFKKADVVEAGLEAKETDIEVNWIFLKHKK